MTHNYFQMQENCLILYGLYMVFADSAVFEDKESVL